MRDLEGDGITNNNSDRDLGSQDTYESPYFEDYNSSGDSYGMAWRYLGVYIDEDGYRKVLWAAYYDANYSGNEIGEYSFYDQSSGEWDNSTCTSGTCRKMDCHDSDSSTWTLIGVYKESLDFDNDNFFEQLFKHQGFCLWEGDNSNYQFMQKMRKTMSKYGECSRIKYRVYLGAKPMEGGNLTYVAYGDSSCSTERSSVYSLDKHVPNKYADSWEDAFNKWNAMMAVYKTCQPCRAYNLYSNTKDNWRRSLIEYNDGEGDEEVNGYNCYDDAEYRNCNQCFKFETHTDMEEAGEDDLYRATRQGTILQITYDGTSYGGSNYDEYYEYENSYELSYTAAGVAVMAVAAIVAKLRKSKRRVIVATGEESLEQPVLQDEVELTK